MVAGAPLVRVVQRAHPYGIGQSPGGEDEVQLAGRGGGRLPARVVRGDVPAVGGQLVRPRVRLPPLRRLALEDSHRSAAYSAATQARSPAQASSIVSPAAASSAVSAAVNVGYSWRTRRAWTSSPRMSARTWRIRRPPK